MIDEYYKRKAKALIPPGFFILDENSELRPSDLVFDWTSNSFKRADWDGWLTSPLINREEMICAIRKAQFEGFGNTPRKSYSIKR